MKNVSVATVLKRWYGVPILIIINIILNGWTWIAVVASCFGIASYYVVMYVMLRFAVPDMPEIPEGRE